MGPCAYGRGEPEVSHDADQTIDIEVVEEPLDIKENKRRRMAGRYSCLRLVHEAHHGVYGAVVISGTELVSGEERIEIKIV